MVEIKLPSKETDFSKMSLYDWDVVLGKNNDHRMRIGRLEGYIHTIGGRWGNNDLYAWPRDEEPTYENIAPFDSDHVVNWGLRYEEYHYFGSHMGDSEIDSTAGTMITRNGEDFYFVRGGRRYSMLKASVIIDDINNGPINYEEIDYDKKNIIGRNIAFHGIPARITLWCNGQGCIIIEPDKGKCKLTDKEIANIWCNKHPEYYEGSIKLDIVGYSHYGVLDWFPNYDD